MVGKAFDGPRAATVSKPSQRENESEPTTLVDKDGVAEVFRLPTRTDAKPRAKKSASVVESLRTATSKRVSHAEDEDSMTEVLGPALVAGPLGRKISDARTMAMLKGITECHVELLSTRLILS